MIETKPKVSKIKINFPWFSLLSTMTTLGLIFSIHHPKLIAPYTLPNFTSLLGFQLALALLVLIIFVSDLQRFIQQKSALSAELNKLSQELDLIWQSKKKLQQRSHIYSGHADKLKQFISDKLLDYIEYDEKFLHFKNIAAEIRHNGVISYDIVRSALEQAAKGVQTPQPAPGTFADTHRFGLPNNPNSDYRQALDAMKYLWDLLDLSTAENIALHIGDYLIECEEQYYLQELTHSKTQINESAQKPYFAPSIAAIKTLSPLLDSNESERVIKQINTPNTENSELAQASHYHESDLFRIKLNPTEHLLGNENHLILLLENLIKNAQFFSSKNKLKQKSDRIAVELTQQQGYVEFAIYNRGPYISKDNLNNIFQLGFSTRRVKEHHGKGLGLFFVKEIVKGYQGQINIKNVHNIDEQYLIHITLANQDTTTREIKIHYKGSRPVLTEVGELKELENLQLNFKNPITSIQVVNTGNTHTSAFTDLDTQQKIDLLDGAYPFTPKWKISVSIRNKEWMLKLTPLDISGVRFSIMLPTAESRLDGTEPNFVEDFENEVKELNAQFSEYNGL